MPNALLALIWIAAAATALFLVDREVLKIGNAPNAQDMVRNNMRAFAGIVVLMGVLYAMSGTTPVLPAEFRPICLIAYLAIAAVFTWVEMTYARKHLPVTVPTSPAR